MDMKIQNKKYVVPAFAGMTRMWDSNAVRPLYHSKSTEMFKTPNNMRLTRTLDRVALPQPLRCTAVKRRLSQRSVKSVSSFIITWLLLSACSPTLTDEEKASKQDVASGWQTDFFDDFDTFNPDNWQDQILWVNNEDQCYVRDNQFNTREVSNGTLNVTLSGAASNSTGSFINRRISSPRPTIFRTSAKSRGFTM